MKYEVDVLIIGGGCAACMAAIEAGKYWRNVIMVDKGIVGRSGSSPTSGGGMSAAFDHNQTGDSVDKHYDDTIVGGDFVNDPFLVNIMTNEIKDLVLESETWGIRYNKAADNLFYQSKTPGNNFSRTIKPIGAGASLMECLRKEVLHRGIEVIENTMIVDLFVIEGRVYGALGFNIINNQWTVFQAKSTILAAGSATALYKYSSATFNTTGDSLFLAAKAGAKLANMEFVEFTVIPKIKNTIISAGGVSPFLTHGSYILNRSGERFLARYDPKRKEKTTKAILVRGIFSEINAGRGPVFNDSTHFTEEKRREFERVEKARLQPFKKAGINYYQEKFEWVPAVHSFLGGIVIDSHCYTGIPGLFAAGECTNTIHGSNRLAGNAISDCFVFGKRAGKFASLYCETNSMESLDPNSIKCIINELEKQFHSQHNNSNLERLKTSLQDIAYKKLGVIRNEEFLIDAEKEIDLIKEQLDSFSVGISSLKEVLEIRNLIFVAQVVAKAALRRNESRGQHFREDFPEKDDENGVKWLIYQDRPNTKWWSSPIPSTE